MAGEREPERGPADVREVVEEDADGMEERTHGSRTVLPPPEALSVAETATSGVRRVDRGASSS